MLRLLGGNPDTAVVNSFGMSSALALRQLRELGFKGTLFTNNGLQFSGEAWEMTLHGNLGELYVEGYDALPAEFSEKYRARYGADPSFYALAWYTDFELFTRAFEAAGADPRAVARYIKGLGRFQGRYLTIEIDKDGRARIPLSVFRIAGALPAPK